MTFRAQVAGGAYGPKGQENKARGYPTDIYLLKGARQGGGPVFLHNLAMMLKPVVYSPGDYILRKGEVGKEMYFICRGQVEVLDGNGKGLATLGEGDYFGEMSLLLSQVRNASIRATAPCDLFVLEKGDFDRVLKDHPDFASSLRETARERSPSAAGTA